MDREKLKEELIRDEGIRLKLYKDSVGLWTIGVGRCLDRVGISRGEALYLLDRDIDTVLSLVENEPWWASVADDDVRARVMLNMAFNMGIATLRKFTNTLEAVQEKRWSAAAAGMRASRWAQQVGARADRLAQMMETGVA